MVLSGSMSCNGIVSSYGSFIPNFLRNLYTVLYSRCISLNSYQSFRKISFSPQNPFWHLLFVYFLMMVILTGVRLYLIVALICISLLMSIFYCLLAINKEHCIYLEKYVLRYSTHFLIGLFVFLILSYMSCLFILKINPLSVALFIIIFSPSKSCLFTEIPCIPIY